MSVCSWPVDVDHKTIILIMLVVVTGRETDHILENLYYAIRWPIHTWTLTKYKTGTIALINFLWSNVSSLTAELYLSTKPAVITTAAIYNIFYIKCFLRFLKIILAHFWTTKQFAVDYVVAAVKLTLQVSFEIYSKSQCTTWHFVRIYNLFMNTFAWFTLFAFYYTIRWI